MKKAIWILTAVALSGCASAKLVPLPDGSTGYVVKNCDDMAECYKKAAEVCGGKYELMDKSGTSVGVVSGAGGYVSGATVPQYTITIKCGDGKATKP